MTEEKKNIDDLTDEEFDKLSEEGKIQPEAEENEETSKPDENQEKDSQEEQEDEKVEEDDEIEDEKEEEKTEAPIRTPHIPYSKHKKEKEKWGEVKNALEEENTGLKKTVEDLQNKLEKSKDAEGMNKDIEEFAEKSNLDKETVIGLANIIKKHSGIDEETSKKMQEFDALQNKLKEESMFESEYEDNVVPSFENINPDASKAQLKKAKAKLTELAYDPKYIKVPLAMIVSHYKDEFTEILGEKAKKKTMEGSTRKKAVENEIADEELSGEDWQNMTDEEFDKRSERLAEKSPSQLEIIRRGEKIN